MSIFSDLFGGADKKAAELFGQAAQIWRTTGEY